MERTDQRRAMLSDRKSLILGAVFALIAIVSFVAFGERFEAGTVVALAPLENVWFVRVAVVVLLIADIVLPVPASLLIGWSATKLGVVDAIVVGTIGLTLSGYAGVMLGRSALRWLANKGDTQSRVAAALERTGPALLIALRAVPILAEFSVVLAGTSGLSWRQVRLPIFLGSALTATLYSFPVLVITQSAMGVQLACAGLAGLYLIVANVWLKSLARSSR